MRHLIIRQHTQRLFLFFILAIALYFVFRLRTAERIQGHQFDFYPEKQTILKKDFFIIDRINEKIPFACYIRPGQNKLFIKSKLENLDFRQNNISAELLIAANLKQESNSFSGISGYVLVRNLKINQHKLLNISTKFKLLGDKLKIVSLKFGDSYSLKGIVGLLPPNLAELNFKITRANIRDLAIIARVKDPNSIYGIMEGEFSIKGPLDNLVSKGNLIGRNGRIGPFTYDSANINFEGFGPILRIVHSRVRQGQGSTALEGFIDLRNIGKKNLYDGIRINSDEKSYAWNGWDITKNGTRQLELKKDISEEFRVGFKTFAQEGPLPYYGKRNDEVHLEYKMGDESLKMKLKEDEEFFGLEKTLRF